MGGGGGGGGGGSGVWGEARVREYFFTKNPNFKGNIFFWGGEGARASDFFYKESKSKIFFGGWVGWGKGGGAGSVSDFLL